MGNDQFYFRVEGWAGGTLSSPPMVSASVPGNFTSGAPGWNDINAMNVAHISHVNTGLAVRST